MSQILVISGHPNLAASNTNTVILDELQTRFDSLSVRRLDRLYPDYQIDVAAEQQALLEADIIVLQYPFYWYSVPALLKKWIDDVFSYNFAYGSKGDKLKGKQFILSFTIGGPSESYQALGYNHFTIEQLVMPLQQTAYLAGMEFHSPVYSHGMVYIPGVYNELSDVQDRAREHAQRLGDKLAQLSDSVDSRIKSFVSQWFANMDKLPATPDLFLPYLDEQLQMVMPEGEFVGVEGFSLWYQGARQTFKPDATHIIEQIRIMAEGDRYLVNLRVRLQAETLADSVFNGQSVNMLVNEVWSVSAGREQPLRIHSYQVEPVKG